MALSLIAIRFSVWYRMIATPRNTNKACRMAMKHDFLIKSEASNVNLLGCSARLIPLNGGFVSGLSPRLPPTY